MLVPMNHLDLVLFVLLVRLLEFLRSQKLVLDLEWMERYFYELFLLFVLMAWESGCNKKINFIKLL
jgi:hypothetical protein